LNLEASTSGTVLTYAGLAAIALIGAILTYNGYALKSADLAAGKERKDR